MALVYISLGTNLGDKLQNISKALRLIKEQCGQIEKRSSVYETEPWGFESDENFLNQVISLKTELPPRQLLHELLAIERKMGRTRHQSKAYTSRIIDLDILFYDKHIMRDENLKIPHPQVQNRKFILVPLAEIGASFMHPVLNKSVKELNADCKDNSVINKI